ncbi:ATP-binding cassette domain-containing protein [Brachybacterium paraconglomeratum]|uniref:ATP-binding cassette domain-containing protein n=1 Tax=Brachybacterium paraconglomeratum TaxID=173362 RepID=UPI003FD0E9C1
MTSTATEPGTRTGSTVPEPAAPAARRSAPDGVRLDGVARSFDTPQGRHDVLRGLDLELRSGEILAVVGPSACGKSTLLRLIAGLDRPPAGPAIRGGAPAPLTPRRAGRGARRGGARAR